MSNAIARAAVDRLNMRAVAIAPAFASTIEHDLQTLAMADPETEKAAAIAARPDMLAALGFNLPFNLSQQKPFAFADGVAVIPVSGMLLNRFGQSWGNYATGYNFIRSQMNAALDDPDVKMIMFDVNSYGGEVNGCFELSDDIFAARGSVPMIAVVDANCYSAAYAVASAADKVILTPSGGAGSIGVIATHFSYQGAMEKAGVKVTYIFAGDNKADGSPYFDLPPDVKANMKADVDYSRQKFAELVARNRNLDVQVVIDTQAQSYRSDEALALGLIDLISPPNRAVAAYTSELSDSSNIPTENFMTGKTTGAESQAAHAVDAAQVASDARTSERQRISGIKALPEAQGKSALADHLALNTELSVESAKGILAAASNETTAVAAPSNAAAETAKVFAAAMEAAPNPDVGAGGDGSAAVPGKTNSKAAGILAAHTAATGTRHGQ